MRSTIKSIFTPRLPFAAAAAFSTAFALLPAKARAQSAAPDAQAAAAPPPATAIPTPAQATQSTAAAPAPASAPITQLSPFEVQSSSKDIGYYTQNTTMGSRLDSNLGDLASSITVISKQQIQDTASVNINDLFLYEASTEGTENYTADNGFGKGGGVNDQIQGSPQTSNRVRGLGSVDVTRDFFLTNPNIQLDVYNVDDVELNRGPNSTLFGIGSPSGILNESIEQAHLDQDTSQVSARFGSFGDFRSTINLNRDLIPDKFAIAVAGLYANAHPTDQEPEYNIQRREFAAMTLKPLPTTTIRANIEYYDNPNRNPNSITPADEVTPWLANGSPKWDPITYTATVNGVTSAPITNSLLLPAGLVSSYGNANVGSPQFYLVHGQVQLWEQAELGTNFAAPGSPTTAVSATNPFGPIGNEREVYTAGNYAKFASTAPAGQVTYPLFHEPGISNPKLLNYQGVNLLSANVGEDKAVTYNVELEQQIAPNLFLDAGWYREQFTSLQHNYMGGNVGNAVMVDPNIRLLNGTPNPYFGEPFMLVQQPADNDEQSLNEQERVALAYQLDFTKNGNWTRWLGHHNLQAFYQHMEQDTSINSYREEILDNHSWSNALTVGSPSSSITDSLSERYYLSNGGAAVSFSPGEFVDSNFTYPVTWYNTQLNGGTWTNENAKLGQALVSTSTNKAQEQVWSYAGSLQDYLFDDHLVLTFGQRHDYERNRITDPLTLDTASGLTDVDNLSQYGGWNSADGITRQAGGVLHITKWLSVHYNQSDNFEVAALGEDEFGNVLPNPSGRGKDYGFALSFFDDKLVGELNWYKSNEADSRQGTETYVQRALRIDYGAFVPWAQEVATNTLGPAATATAINNYAQTIVQFPTGLQGLTNATQHAADTETVEANGWEVNLIYNPVRNWTMKFTADEDIAVDSDVFPHVQAYLASRLPVWTKATDPILGPFWTTVDAGNLTQQYNISSGSPQQFLAGTVDAAGLDVEIAQQGHDQPDLSKYHFTYLTNYQFVSGLLSGFGLGTALRYETPAAIGYLGGSPDPSALGAIDTLQAFDPVYGKELLHQDLWISYRLRLPFLDRRVRATVQLNCRDVWSDGYLQTVGVNPDGSAQAFRIIPPRQWYLQTTFDL